MGAVSYVRVAQSSAEDNAGISNGQIKHLHMTIKNSEMD